MNKNWFVGNDIAYLHIENDVMFGVSTSKHIEILAKAIGSKGRYLSEVRMVQNISYKITESIKELAERYQILIISGGVGITHDCNTTFAISNVIGCELEESSEAKLYFEEYLKKQGMEFLNVHKKAITLPKECVVIPNEIMGIVGYKIQNITVVPSNIKSFRYMCNAIAMDTLPWYKKYTHRIQIDVEISNVVQNIEIFVRENSNIQIDIHQSDVNEIVVYAQSFEMLELSVIRIKEMLHL